MRYFVFLLTILIVSLLFYYVTAVFHILLGIFGKQVTFPKVLIPFYGWFKIL